MTALLVTVAIPALYGSWLHRALTRRPVGERALLAAGGDLWWVRSRECTRGAQ